MSTTQDADSNTSTVRSVFFTSSFIVALCTAIVTASLEFNFYNSAVRNVDESVRIRGREMVELVADQVGGALKFGKVEIFEEVFAKAISGSGGSAVSAGAFTATGDLLFGQGIAAADSDALQIMAIRSIEMGAAVFSKDRFLIVVPVRFGKDGHVVGAVSMRWTSGPLKDLFFRDQLISLGVGCVLFLLGLAGAVFFLRTRVSLPLVRLRDAMAEVADANYAIDIPGKTRGDEIGAIARTLERFRKALKRAKKTTEDSIFKGAAFEGSTAAMMMIDRNFQVQYVNASCRNLLADFREFFAGNDPDFDPDMLVGRHVNAFLDPGTLPADLVQSANELPFDTDICFCERRIHLDVSSVNDASGVQIGCVLEWEDVTADRLNQAALDSIDANQIRAEFLIDGTLSLANANIADAIGVGVDDLTGRPLADLFFQLSAANELREIELSALTDGERLTGRFAAQSSGGARVVVDGSFTKVLDSAGRPLRIIFIGSDVTQSLATIQASEAKRAAMEAAQAAVVEQLSVVLGRLADGDLTGRIVEVFSEEYEELRGNFNMAMDRLLSAMKHVVDSTELIGSEAHDISSAADDLSRRTERQAATLEETAAALDELTTSVKSAADGAKQASQMASSAKASAERSEDVVRETVSAMGEIEQSSKEISKIINVIEDIAFQTNLLALNAGVEAARAGESGRGFAVVASEVRALAQRSSEAAQEINALISKSGAQVKRGVGLVDQMGSALGDIVNSVSEISNHVVGIAASVLEQSGSLNEINTAMSQLDRVTQQNAAMFQETTAASHALTSEAQSLSETTLRFKVSDTAVARASGSLSLSSSRVS